MLIPITIDNPQASRAIAPGETRTLTGLVDFPEYNGQKVKITAIRMDGPKGKAYYVEGKINDVVNWIYKCRLV